MTLKYCFYTISSPRESSKSQKINALRINIESALEYSPTAGDFYIGNSSPMGFAEDLFATLGIDSASKKEEYGKPSVAKPAPPMVPKSALGKIQSGLRKRRQAG